MLKISDILKEIIVERINENISDAPEYNVALGKIAGEKARNILRNLGVNFDKGSCSIAIGSIDDFEMNSYVRLIPYGDNIITPAQRETAATKTSSQTFNVYGSDLNFSPQSKGQNQQQSPQIGEQIVLSGVTFEWMGQQWNSVSQKSVWVDNNNNPYTGNVQMLNTQYVLNESKNKILNYSGFDYLMTNVGWATYNKNTGKTGIVVTKKTNKQPNQSTLNMIWLKQNPIPNGYKLNYNGNEYISTTKKVTNTVSKQINQQLTTEWLKQKSNNQQQNQTNQITNYTVLDDIVLKQGGYKILCELEFYQFNSNDINQPLNKGFNPRKIKPGELIKCKNTYYVKILSPNPNPQKIVGKPCEWGVIHITRLEKN
jgi:hypothetical protein